MTSALDCPADCPTTTTCTYCASPACPRHDPDGTISGCPDGTSHRACHEAYCRDRDCFEDPDAGWDRWRDEPATVSGGIG